MTVEDLNTAAPTATVNTAPTPATTTTATLAAQNHNNPIRMPTPHSLNHSLENNTYPDKLAICIRSPTKETDFTARIQPDWTIETFKEWLAAEYPGKPIARRQRLIFGGRLLTDKDVISEVVKKCDKSIPQIFHLVLHPSEKESVNLAAQRATVPSKTSPPPQAGLPLNTPAVGSSSFAHSHTRHADGVPSSSFHPNPLPSASPSNPPSHPGEPSVGAVTPVTLVGGIPYQVIKINGLPYLMSLPSSSTLPIPHINYRPFHISNAGGARTNSQQQPPSPHQHPIPPPPQQPLPQFQPQAEPLYQPQLPQQRPPDLGEFAQRVSLMFQWCLKFALFMFIFGRHISTLRFAFMIAAGFVAFLHQTGQLRVIRGRMLPNGEIVTEEQNNNDTANDNNRERDDHAFPRLPPGPLQAIGRAAWAFLSSLVPGNQNHPAGVN